MNVKPVTNNVVNRMGLYSPQWFSVFVGEIGQRLGVWSRVHGGGWTNLGSVSEVKRTYFRQPNNLTSVSSTEPKDEPDDGTLY